MGTKHSNCVELPIPSRFVTLKEIVELEAQEQLWLWIGDADHQGYDDGFLGKEKRSLPPEIPELFEVCYNQSYTRGEKHKSRMVSKQILSIERELVPPSDEKNEQEDKFAWVSPENYDKKIEEATVLPSDSIPEQELHQRTEDTTPKKGFWRSYGSHIVTGIGIGAVSGMLGYFIGFKKGFETARHARLDTPKENEDD